MADIFFPLITIDDHWQTGFHFTNPSNQNGEVVLSFFTPQMKFLTTTNFPLHRKSGHTMSPESVKALLEQFHVPGFAMQVSGPKGLIVTATHKTFPANWTFNIPVQIADFIFPH